MNFKNKVVWITGASSGLGEAMAKLFNEHGAQLILSSRNVAALEKVQRSFVNKEALSVILPLDLRAYHTFEELAEKAINAFGKIDILINNGGISQRSFAVDTPFSEELRLLETDLIGTIALTKAALPQLLLQKGQIVVISSVMGKINTKYRTSYAAAKHGLVGYFESLRLELADEGVNVCNIMPGFIATNITKNSLGTSPELVKSSQNNKGLSPEKFARLALKAIYQRKGNVYIGGFKEGLAMILKRISPAIFDFFIKNQKVT
jgi:short-subunit dehydrogenase